MTDVIVYVDIVGDLFHYGHVELFKRCTQYGNILKVGIHSDADVDLYKRLPVLNMNERVSIVECCKYVNEVIPNAPILVTKEYLNKHNINIVIHGDDISEHNKQYMYGDVLEYLKLIPYTPGISTTDIINRIKARNY